MGQISKLNSNNLDAFFSKTAELRSCRFELQNGVHRFFILREDLLHPALSGNKFRKLYGWLKQYYEGNFQSIESMGGGHSNHLSALAYACLQLKIPCTFFVPVGSNSLLLTKLKDCTNVLIKEVSRADFRALREKRNSESMGVLWIPEGGKGEPSVVGFSAVAKQIKAAGKRCFVCAGTGSTAMALANYGVETHALLAVKDTSVKNRLENHAVKVVPTYTVAKFGKLHPEALQLAASFYTQTGIVLDPVYQAKALLLLCNEKSLNENTVFIHTGGLQGWLGYPKELEANFPERIKNDVYANFDAIFTP